MGNITLKERIRLIIGDIAWKLFIWAQWAGDENLYLETIKKESSNNK